MRKSTAAQLAAWPISLAIVVLVAIGGQGTALADASPGLSTQASSSGLPAGGSIYDSATLGGGANPTGLLTFRLFGPDDGTCEGTPLVTTTTTVNGNGYFESSRYVTNAAGTYHWTVGYGGDGNNNPTATTACLDPGGKVVVAKRSPTLGASAGWVAPASVSTAAITGAGPAGPTGTLSYNVFGPDNMTCAGGPVFTTTRSVSGAGSYTSPGFSPTESGTYQWVVNYSGDANNYARSTTCSETANGFTTTVVGGAVVNGTPATVARGGTITVSWSGITSPTSGDWLGLYKVGTVPGGTVAAWKYTGGGASGSTSLKFPWMTAAGTYEVRLMANASIQLIDTSSPLTLVW